MSQATQQLAVIEGGAGVSQVLAQSNRLAALREPVRVLDIYAPGGVAVEQVTRFDALATISAGEKIEGAAHPVVSRDGKIILHDADNRAPGLLAALQANQFKSVTVAFPGDDINLFVQQRFAKYSATKLEAYGDDKGITVIRGGQHHFVAPDSPDFARVLAECKVVVSVYFHLAEWTPDGPQVVFPDGLGLYRLRFTSRNSLRNIIAAVQTITRYTSGRIAGLPVQLSITYREVSAPNGDKRTVPVWQCLLKPPGRQTLNSNNFRELADAGIAQAALLMLPMAETLEDAARDVPPLDLDEAEVAEVAVNAMAHGGYCDADHWRKTWHAVVAGTDLGTDEGRADFLAMYTNGVTDSLSTFLKTATEDDASALVEAARRDMRALIVSDGAGNLINKQTGEVVGEDTEPVEIVLTDLANRSDDALKMHMAYLKKHYPESPQRGPLAAEWKRRYPAENRAPRAPEPAPVVLDQPASPGVMTNGPQAPASGPNLHQEVRSVVAGGTAQSPEDAAEADALFGGDDTISEGEVVDADPAEAALMAAAPVAATAPKPRVKRSEWESRFYNVLDQKGFVYAGQDGAANLMLMLNQALSELSYAERASLADVPTGNLMMVVTQLENGSLDPSALYDAAVEHITG